MKNTVIFDLDGTLAIIDKRRLKANNPDGTINWDIFFDPKNIPLDEPNEPVIEILRQLYDSLYTVVILSGRSDRTRNATKKWLLDNRVWYNKLIMRKDGDYTPDDELKESFLQILIDDNFIPSKDDILCVFDDRDKVVAMWRKNNIPCFQVAEGNF